MARPAVPHILAAALMTLVASLITSCGLLQRPSPAPAARHPGFELLHAGPAVLWVDWARCGEPLRDEEQALAFALATREMGITHLGLETRGHDGESVLGSGHPHHQSLLAVREAARAADLRLALIHPLFLAPGDTDSARLLHDTEWQDGGPAARLFRPAGEDTPGVRLSPALPANRELEMQALAEVLQADLDFDFLILVEGGFPSVESDVGPAARHAFELWSGLSFRQWPAEVLGTSPPPNPYMAEERGELWNAWLAWRAGLWREIISSLRRTVEDGPGPAPPIALLVDAPYPMHLRQGINWASPARPVTEDFGWLPHGYETTGTGHLLDSVVLGFWEVGMQTREEASEAGFAWWVSMEGAVALAERYRRGGSAIWAAIPAGGEGNWADAARSALEETDGLVLISAGDFLETPALWEELGGRHPL